MVVRRGILALGSLVLVCMGGLAAGCTSDQVVYVDERGNEIAVDDQGRPVVSQPTFARPTTARAPSVVTSTPSTALPAVVSDDEGITLDAPAGRAATPTDPDLPPTGALPALPTLPALPAQPARPAPVEQQPSPEVKKVDSSAGLDRPPAG